MYGDSEKVHCATEYKQQQQNVVVDSVNSVKAAVAFSTSVQEYVTILVRGQTG